MKCKKCGCELGVGSQFCNQCGTKCEEEEKSIGQQPITKGKALFVLLVMVGIAYVSFSSSDKDSSQKERSTKSSVAEIDEDALADKNCKNELGFSNIYACRRALSSAGIDADKYIREKAYGLWCQKGKPNQSEELQKNGYRAFICRPYYRSK